MHFSSLFLLFGSFILFDQIYLLKNSIKAQTLKDEVNLPENIKSFSISKKDLFLINKNLFGLHLENNLYNSKNKFINFIVKENNLKKENNNVQIESDTQYEAENIFYAEGNVVIYFSNLKFTADKASFDKNKRKFILYGNITFSKGAQYFEASRLTFDFKKEIGTIENVNGKVDLKEINYDLDLITIKKENKRIEKITDLENINSDTLGFINNLEKPNQSNNTNIDLQISDNTNWRFKSKEIKFESNKIKSNEIYFTNDIFNRPQFIFKSKNFTAEIINDQLKVDTKKNSINIDNLIYLPIGSKSIYNDNSLTSWSLGSDHSDKDGYFISKNLSQISIFEDYKLKIIPYFLIERSIKGYTKSFRKKDSSYFTNKVKNDLSLADLFGFDAEINKRFINWDLLIKSNFNTLNQNRFFEYNRTNIQFSKTVNLSKPVNKNNQKENVSSDRQYNEFLDFRFYSSYREKVKKVFSGDSEIYFGKGFTLSNIKKWEKYKNKTAVTYIYDIGKFKGENSNKSQFEYLLRNLFAVKFSHRFPVWKKNNLDKKINKDYQFTPKVIKQGLTWNINFDGGLFFYDNGESQKAVSIATGPVLTMGSLKKNMFDYSRLEMNVNFISKSGLSPFKFDDIDDTNKLQIIFNQQILGPIVFGYATNLKIDSSSGEQNLNKPKYSIDINRRAYSFGLFYDKENESIGAKFNIFNFGHQGAYRKF